MTVDQLIKRVEKSPASQFEVIEDITLPPGESEMRSNTIYVSPQLYGSLYAALEKEEPTRAYR